MYGVILVYVEYEHTYQQRKEIENNQVNAEPELYLISEQFIYSYAIGQYKSLETNYHNIYFS